MVFVLLAALPVAACVEEAVEITAVEQPYPKPESAGSPRGASVAIASLEGAPDDVEARFSAALVAATKDRDITIADLKQARYTVRGYLTAYPVEGGTAFSYVWDVFAGEKGRSQRVSDAVVVKGTADDPWTLVDDKVLSDLVSHSTDDLAAYLSNTPEAVAARAKELNVARRQPAPAPQPSNQAAIPAEAPTLEAHEP
ncbi:hypothetical protein DYH55_14700 [Methylovirgula sp. 4M-Z18]|nr:hypothetical protein DYH55_14700 [Methylovirgula sp. 4M-Z18]